MLYRLPGQLLRVEGLAVLVTALVLYFDQGFGWVALVVCFLAPDLSLVGYLGGARAGALSYNVAHTYVLPLSVGVVGARGDSDVAVQIALIWIAHIGLDRVLGYGLKYPSAFRDTHLQRV